MLPPLSVSRAFKIEGNVSPEYFTMHKNPSALIFSIASDLRQDCKLSKAPALALEGFSRTVDNSTNDLMNLALIATGFCTGESRAQCWKGLSSERLECALSCRRSDSRPAQHSGTAIDSSLALLSVHQDNCQHRSKLCTYCLNMFASVLRVCEREERRCSESVQGGSEENLAS